MTISVNKHMTNLLVEEVHRDVSFYVGDFYGMPTFFAQLLSMIIIILFVSHCNSKYGVYLRNTDDRNKLCTHFVVVRYLNI